MLSIGPFLFFGKILDLLKVEENLKAETTSLVIWIYPSVLLRLLRDHLRVFCVN